MRITRPKGRVRIETDPVNEQRELALASPGRKAGCGLKLVRIVLVPRPEGCITRPKGRVRIETGCLVLALRWCLASPGRKAGCGLKPVFGPSTTAPTSHHPAERPGAD